MRRLPENINDENGIPGADIIAELYGGQLLQPVEFNNAASYWGSRAHMQLAMMSYDQWNGEDGDLRPAKPNDHQVFQNMWEQEEFIPQAFVDFYRTNFEQIGNADRSIALNIYKTLTVHMQWEIIATEVVCFDLFQLYLHNEEFKVFQTRADFIARDRSDGNIILGDYKTKWSAHTQSTTQSLKDWRQVIVNAHFFELFYGLKINKIALVYGLSLIHI